MERRISNLTPGLDPRGRAAGSNAVSRYEPYHREAVDDGWEIDEERHVLRTEVSDEVPRSAITRNTSPDVPFDRSINPYRGCEHGCIYCFARPTHAYLGLSPGLDFETKLVARPGIDKVLARDLARRKYQCAPIGIGTNTDPYQPAEKTYRLMRRILKVLLEHRHPVTILTKGTLIERDIDLLSELASQRLVQVGVSVTTLDARLSRQLEPRAPAPARRMQVLAALADAGIPTRVSVAPIIPALTDHELEAILDAAAGAGVKAASWIMLRLPLEVAPLFEEWLHQHVPDRADRILSRLREMHGGQTYAAEWGHRMRGKGHYAQIIAHRFQLAMKRSGLVKGLPELDCTQFAVPGRGRQLDLFG